MKESRIVRNIIQGIKAMCPRAYVRKIADHFTRGIPDLLVIFPLMDGLSITLLIEVKTEDGEVSPIQLEEHRQIFGANGDVIVARSWRQVREILEKLLYKNEEA